MVARGRAPTQRRERVTELVDSVARSAAWRGLDAATEQLYDELFARIAAIADIVPSLRAPIGPLATHGELVGVASRAVTSLRSGHDTDAARRLIRDLWPTNTAPHAGHAWWSTPLGRVLADRVGADDDDDAPAASRSTEPTTPASGQHVGTHPDDRVDDRLSSVPRSPNVGLRRRQSRNGRRASGPS